MRRKDIRRYAQWILAVAAGLFGLCAGLASADTGSFNAGDGKLIIFPRPEGVDPSLDYQVFVDEQPVFCYPSWRLDNIHATTNINNRPVSPVSFAVFDFDRPVRVKLILRQGLISDSSRVQILPSAENIKPSVCGDTVEFALNSPGNITIDPNGDGQNALHLFTNLPETDIPDPMDPRVVYFAPGVHETGSIILTEGQTLYIAGGAVLRPLPEKTGKIYRVLKNDYDCSAPAIQIKGANITVRGRGIVSGWRGFGALQRFNMIHSDNAADFTVRDVIIVDNPEWSVLFKDSRGISVDNLKVLGYFQNSDGICVSGCSDVIVRNSFVHTADDALEIKAWQPVDNVRFEYCQVWSDSGTPMGITGEIFAPVKDAVWKGITVLHYISKPPKSGFIDGRAAILVMAQSGGAVSDVVFEDICIESNLGLRPAIRISNEKLKWDGTPRITDPPTPYSSISNVVMRNIMMKNFANPKTSDRLLFVDASGSNIVSRIMLENVFVNGVSVRDGDPRIEARGGVPLKILP